MFSALPPTVIYIPLTATHPQGGIEHTAGAFCSAKHIPPGGRRARERDRQMAGLYRRRANSTNEPAPSPPPGVGAFGTSVPDPLLLPAHTSLHPSEPRLTRAGSREAPWRDEGMRTAPSGGWRQRRPRGNLTRKLRTKPASFSVPGFFPESNACCALFSPYVFGEGCPEWGWWIFFSLKQFFLNAQSRGIWEKVKWLAPLGWNPAGVGAWGRAEPIV